MKEEFFAWNLDITDQLTNQLTLDTIKIALFVGTICFVCNIAYNFLSSGFSKLEDSNTSFPNYAEIARCFVLMFCITAYMPIAQTIVGTIETVNNYSASDSLDDIKRFLEIQEESTVKGDPEGVDFDENGIAKPLSAEKQAEIERNKVEQESGGIIATLKRIVTVIMPSTLIPTVLHLIAMLLFALIRVVVYGIAIIMTKLLVILGPLAFAFSILPVFKRQLEQWFSTLVTCGMTITTLNILDRIVNAMTGQLFGNMISGDLSYAFDPASKFNHLEVMALDFVLVIVYASTFWVTSKYVGKGDAGRMLSKAVGVATSLAAIAMTAGAGAGAGAGSIGSSAGTAKNLIDSNSDE